MIGWLLETTSGESPSPRIGPSNYYYLFMRAHVNPATTTHPTPPPPYPSPPPVPARLSESSPFRCSVDANGEARVTVKHKGEDKVVGAETLCRHLFEHLKDIAEAFAGEPVGRCVISVPAGFTAEQREALRAVGKQAGLPFSLVLSDSVSAAIAYGLDRTDGEMAATSRDGGGSK